MFKTAPTRRTWPGSPAASGASNQCTGSVLRGSPGHCRPSDVTGPDCSATCRYETASTTDFADPVDRACAQNFADAYSAFGLDNSGSCGVRVCGITCNYHLL